MISLKNNISVNRLNLDIASYRAVLRQTHYDVKITTLIISVLKVLTYTITSYSFGLAVLLAIMYLSTVSIAVLHTLKTNKLLNVYVSFNYRY